MRASCPRTGRTSRFRPTRSSEAPKASASVSATGSRSSAGSARAPPRSRSASLRRRPASPPSGCSQLGSLLEGHSDNLAAALVGGACLTSGGRIAQVAETLPVVPIAIVPEGRVSTRGARAALPETISHADAAFTAAHAALLGAGLASGRLDVLAGAFEDRLHEPYRAAAAPLLGRVRAEWPAGAIGVTLSGSGPTVIVWARPEQADDCETRSRAASRTRVLQLGIAPRGAL